MSLEMWIFFGLIACGALVWYLYQRSKNDDTSENTEPQPDDTANADDEYEDLLLTGIMLSEVYDDDDSSDDVDHSMDDSGGFDDSGFE
ncbi:hypothetical protein C6499_00310 [Candidatus Poribacteria bacterium]|nr:MAG: hypothetical protein C6499_00310 [Candidatus Poribacteria bacterium]